MSGRNTPAEAGIENITRRGALKTIAAGAMVAAGMGCERFLPQSKLAVKGRIAGASHSAGHLLRSGAFPTPSAELKTGIAIIGAGVAGMSAAWALNKNGFSDFTVLELEAEAGGNAGYGCNSVTRYPRGAYYVPLPGPEGDLVRKIFEDAGVIEGYSPGGLPVFSEYHLCADPMERLFIHGVWQEGSVPQLGLSENDKRQYHEFFAEMERLKHAKGKDGKRPFALPMEYSSRDAEFTSLDAISMADYMTRKGWNSKYLLWYVDYCMKDDFGTPLSNVSAWAGIHYFASRAGTAANADSQAVLTWPEGNGFLVNHMKKGIESKIKTGVMTFNIENREGSVTVDYYDPASNKSGRLSAKAAIFAAPRFTASKIIKDMREGKREFAAGFSYAPWIVANVTLSKMPAGRGAPLSWDNVRYGASSLGYIVATHQSLSQKRSKTVITFYSALCEGEPAVEREAAIRKTFGDWAGYVTAELSKAHPGIERDIEEMEVWVWGHGMIRPTPGFIWGEERMESLKPLGGIHFAHSDMSGMSIFEEAQYRGVKAAVDTLKYIGLPHGSLAV